MTRTDGEHELVLGNKQLLSAFFVVVILLGVFFTMGYFVGKNTTASGFNGGTTASGDGARPGAAGRPLDSGSPTPAGTAPDSTTPAVDPNTPASPPDSSSSTRPAASPPIEAKVESRPEAKTEAHTEPKTEPKTPPHPERKPLEAADPSNDAMAQPTSEQKYLQVSAVRRPDADNMVKVLRERGFPALLGESSKQGLYRVLVGPFKTTGELGRTKADLKAKGFESIVAK